MSLVDRAKGILMNPKNEWAVIDTEPATVGSLYSGYIIPLAAIPAVASFIGMSLIGFSVLGFRVRMPVGSGLTSAVVAYVLGLVGVFVLALIIDALAPSFGGQKSQIQALKVAGYSMTASWVAGIFLVIPSLAILAALGGLYGLFLLFLGLPILMKAPQEKAVGYTVVVIIVAIVLYLVIGLVVRSVVPYPLPGLTP
ncbi:MAG TPA: Yip1 family protein [Gemmatimonadales bacterium]|nr:Yip1 family protein [Gemmatimonadales bacterium]